MTLQTARISYFDDHSRSSGKVAEDWATLSPLFSAVVVAALDSLAERYPACLARILGGFNIVSSLHDGSERVKKTSAWLFGGEQSQPTAAS